MTEMVERFKRAPDFLDEIFQHAAAHFFDKEAAKQRIRIESAVRQLPKLSLGFDRSSVMRNPILDWRLPYTGRRLCETTFSDLRLCRDMAGKVAATNQKTADFCTRLLKMMPKDAGERDKVMSTLKQDVVQVEFLNTVGFK